MRSVLATLVFGSTISTAALAQVVPTSTVDYTGHKLVRVEANRIRDFQALNLLAVSLWNCNQGPGINDAQISPDKWQAFLDLNLPYSIMMEDVEVKLRQERDQIALAHMQRDAAWFTTYHNLDEINAKLDADLLANPTLTRSLTIGNSLQNRTIRGIAISAPDQPGNPRNLRPQIIFNGCQHAREWISPATIMYFSEQLATQYSTNARITNILNNVEILLVPVVNPDGYVWTWTNLRLWRKNRRDNGDGTIGVDTNRNWGYQWGGEGASTDPNNDTYRGTGPFSEPETQALSNFILANPRIKAHIDFHSYSQLILSPWAYTASLPADAMVFDTLNAKMAAAVRAPFNMTYVAGPTYTTIYPASGASGDWSYGAANALGFGWELRDTGTNGFILPADQIIPTGIENLAAILELGDWIAQPLNFTFPDGLPTQAIAGNPSTFRVGVVSGGSTPIATPPTMFTRDGSGTWIPAALIPTASPGIFNATISASTCGENIDYYFEATAANTAVVQSPVGGATAPNIRITTPVPVYSDNFETNTGWSYASASDTATLGRWERAVPQATAAQPGNDNPLGTGTLCAITDSRAGTGVGSYDIDGGTTTLTSPTFDGRPPSGTPASEMKLSYARWYSNNAGGAPNADSMPIELSNNGGTTWTQIELVTENANAWVTRTWTLNSILPLTANMKVRFVARDLATGSVVEAGVDDFRIFFDTCPCPADFNGDTIVDFFDYLDFVDSFSANSPSADFNNDSIIDFFDYLDFVDAFSVGC